MDRLTQVIGIGLVLIALIDIYLTVLYPRSKNWISMRFSRLIWSIFQHLAAAPIWRTLGFGANFRQRLLSYCGPTVLVVVVLLWVFLLITGFACIVWPVLGSDIQVDESITPINFITALYYSGCVFTTLGTGNFTPQTSLFRLLAPIESGLGFVIFTLTITYLLSVYSALTQRNIFALSLHYRTASTADAAEMLARLGTNGSFEGARETIGDISRSLLILLESHHAYPVVHYFRFQEPYYALARLILIAMDTAALIRSVLDQERYRSLTNCTVVVELGEGGRHLLRELSKSFLPGKTLNSSGQSEMVLRERFYRAVERFKQEGIATTSDLEAGLQRYIALRREWEPYAMEIAAYMGYSWQHIAPGERID
jgi:hypothetical protein